MAGQPLLLASADFWTLDTLVDRLKSIAAKSRPEPTQSVAGRPWVWGSRPALEPL
jgi:hypothetical protein